jgi:hypothetical protein
MLMGGGKSALNINQCVTAVSDLCSVRFFLCLSPRHCEAVTELVEVRNDEAIQKARTWLLDCFVQFDSAWLLYFDFAQ